MRLRNFLIFAGLWTALLPHLGFSIVAENVLFSITGFVLIVSSFYVAAIEDKHRHKRIIQGEVLEETNQKFGSVLNRIKKTTVERVSKTSQKPVDYPSERKEKISANIPEKEMFIFEEAGGPPRIRKAVSDVKIKAGSEDDIVS